MAAREKLQLQQQQAKQQLLGWEQEAADVAERSRDWSLQVSIAAAGAEDVFQKVPHSSISYPAAAVCLSTAFRSIACCKEQRPIGTIQVLHCTGSIGRSTVFEAKSQKFCKRKNDLRELSSKLQ